MIDVAAQTGTWNAAPSTRTATVRVALFGIWLAVFVALVATHAPWRDEVHALSVVREASDWMAFVAGVKAEAHPGLWYLLLAAVDAAVGGPATLTVASSLVAVTAFGLLILRGPFPLWMTGLIAFLPVFVFHFGVIARNYGIAWLLMLVFAAAMRRPRPNAPVIAVLLFLLPNTNVHSAMLTPVFGLLWAWNAQQPVPLLRRAAAMLRDRLVLAVGAAALAGLALTFATVYPPVHDYALPTADGVSTRLALAWLLPGLVMPVMSGGYLPGVLATFLLIVLIASFRDEPDLAIAATAALFVMVTAFAVLYPGGARHQALLLGAVVAFAWIAEERRGRRRDRPVRLWFALPLGLVFATSLPQIPAVNGRVLSMSTAACEAIRARPDLAEAVILAEPQWLVEPLVLHCDNPTYLWREQRFGAVSQFRRDALRSVASLDDLSETASRLAAERKVPVVVLIGHRIDWEFPEPGYSYYYRPFSKEPNVRFTLDRESAAEFRAKAELILPRMRTRSDESYNVFVVR